MTDDKNEIRNIEGLADEGRRRWVDLVMGFSKHFVEVEALAEETVALHAPGGDDESPVAHGKAVVTLALLRLIDRYRTTPLDAAADRVFSRLVDSAEAVMNACSDQHEAGQLERVRRLAEEGMRNPSTKEFSEFLLRKLARRSDEGGER